MELVALSELLEQTITVYQEQDEKIVTQDFCPKKTTHKPKVELCLVSIKLLLMFPLDIAIILW